MSKEENTQLMIMNLYFKLYVGCIEYKASKKINNKINCDKYYDNYEKYLSKLNKNNTIFK